MKTNAIILLFAMLALAGCDGQTDNGIAGSLAGGESAGAALDKKAIEVGILPDAENLVFGGRYETRSEMGTDKFCAVKSGTKQFDIGVLAVFGPESKCEARGRATISGEKVKISFSGKDTCSFDAGFDGIELRFPGSMEKGCETYCSPRASFSGTSYFIVEQGDDNARRALGRDFEKLCP
jgi:hypothetical protein